MNEGFCDYPPIYWLIDREKMPPEIEINYISSSTGDECHCNIRGLSDGEAKNIIKTSMINGFYLCNSENEEIVLNNEIIDELSSNSN